MMVLSEKKRKQRRKCEFLTVENRHLVSELVYLVEVMIKKETRKNFYKNHFWEVVFFALFFINDTQKKFHYFLLL